MKGQERGNPKFNIGECIGAGITLFLVSYILIPMISVSLVREGEYPFLWILSAPFTVALSLVIGFFLIKRIREFEKRGQKIALTLVAGIVVHVLAISATKLWHS